MRRAHAAEDISIGDMLEQRNVQRCASPLTGVFFCRIRRDRRACNAGASRRTRRCARRAAGRAFPRSRVVASPVQRAGGGSHCPAVICPLPASCVRTRTHQNILCPLPLPVSNKIQLTPLPPYQVELRHVVGEAQGRRRQKGADKTLAACACIHACAEGGACATHHRSVAPIIDTSIRPRALSTSYRNERDSTEMNVTFITYPVLPTEMNAMILQRFIQCQL